jgi:deoxyribonuclease-4
MKTVGLHLRISTDIEQAVLEAQVLGIDSFQCFLINQTTNRYIDCDAKPAQQFLMMRQNFGDLYIHGSYWINLGGKETAHSVSFLQREIEMAKRLQFNAIVLHPGSATGWTERDEGIEQFVRLFNPLLKEEHELKFILENTAHGNRTIGSDLHDLKAIYDRLEHPEKVSFCIDTAHAFAFGYDIAQAQGQDEFIELIQQTIGLERISLVHLNDTDEMLGTKKDKHQLLGQGQLGESLARFVQMPAFNAVPIMLELPQISVHEQKKEMISLVRRWSK